MCSECWLCCGHVHRGDRVVIVVEPPTGFEWLADLMFHEWCMQELVFMYPALGKVPNLDLDERRAGE